jgi:hypothetical protein
LHDRIATEKRTTGSCRGKSTVGLAVDSRSLPKKIKIA